MAKAPEKQDESRIMKDDWFGDTGVTHNEYPRIAIGDPDEATGDSIVLMNVSAYYIETQSEIIDGKTRLLHQVQPREPINGEPKVLIWGNHQLDAVLPTLPRMTKIRATFRQKRKIKGGKTVKEIHIEWPDDVKRIPNPFRDIDSTEPF